MKITSFNKTNLTIIENDIVSKLKEIEEKYGISITRGGGRFQTLSFDMKLQIKIKEVNGVSSEEINFKNNCDIFDMNPEDFGKEFSFSGKIYEIAGINLKKRTKPIMIKCRNDGKIYCATAEMVKAFLK